MWMSSNDWLVNISRDANQGVLSKWRALSTIPMRFFFNHKLDAFVHYVHDIQYLFVGHVSVMNRTYQLVCFHTHYDHNHV